ncbi:DUF1835 domain-containing protein [Dyadobacter sp. CY356]|uniref:DUF1835 domain-containing protein n=1 Tax=Dyadobacter sp. CY356 TaxID=2906442 RepID=UPI001F29F2C1|nr:DUF1835 domain-containing protein [Dyadobacter sp. CY356]MCF0054316.1 DUF1835 domain-containing protein [Dyadobacter sp. CY356]
MISTKNKTFHILNGDALLDNFPAELLTGEIIIARECLVDGPVNGETPEAFWETRAGFIQETYGEEKEVYFEEVVTEFEKIKAIPANSEVNFWFEDDLFCQANLWFCASLLLPVAHTLKSYIIKPPLIGQEPDWRGFGPMDRHALADAYLNKQELSLADLSLLANLWDAYKNDNREKFAELAMMKSENFRFLSQVIQAQLDRKAHRPEMVLKQIMQEKETTDFKTIFKEFGKREGIYGFGDWQVEKLLEKIQ